MDTSEPDARATELKSKRDEAYNHWLALRRDPDCLRDPVKRTQMLQARLAYLDAAVEYVFVLRESQGRQAGDE